MNKSTKGAMAAAAAGVLLLGGAGTLAFWTDTETVTGGTIGAGHMSITAPSCSSWTYDAGEALAGATFTPGTSVLVPGDVITETCTTTFSAEGEHLRATLTATPGTSDNLFTSGDLVLGGGSSLQYSSDGGTTWNAVPGSGLTEANDGDQVRLAVTVTFDSAADNTTQDVDSALGAITIQADQIHA